jgi:hypothetical protein
MMIFLLRLVFGMVKYFEGESGNVILLVGGVCSARLGELERF